jgi:hypothetical protein
VPDRREPDPARHELADIDEAALRVARAIDIAIAAARARESERWVGYLAPLPDRFRDDSLRDLRATARRARAAYGPKDSIRDAIPEEASEPLLLAIDRLLKAIARFDANR